MFEQIDTTFQRGLAEHTAGVQQQFEASHSALAASLQVLTHIYIYEFRLLGHFLGLSMCLWFVISSVCVSKSLLPTRKLLDFISCTATENGI